MAVWKNPDHREVQQRIVELLQDLVRIPSPFFQEESIFDFLYEAFRERFRCTRQFYTETRYLDHAFHGQNLVVDLGPVEKGMLVFNGHIDTVIPTADWTSPFDVPLIEGTRMQGLGTVDMKGGVAGFLVAMECLQQAKVPLQRGIRLIIVSDEEGPFSLGTLHSLEGGFYEGAQGVLIGEAVVPFSSTPVHFPAIALGARGRVLHRVLVEGKPAHGATPHLGVNALGETARLLSALDGLPLLQHPLLGSESLCPLMVSGGQKTLSVPARCELFLDRHLVPGSTLQSASEQFQQLVDSLESPANIHFSLEEQLPDGLLYPPCSLPEQTPLVQSLSAAIRKVTGKSPAYTGFSSISDLNVLAARLDVPVFIFGPDGGFPHRGGEYVEIPSLVDFCLSLVEFCALWGQE